ncbi:phospholipid/cholesterol/gamma-HCH transport system permease protein [Halopseudomonas xinjiangensis]|uniref:Phospholipid/cholesterol/gamma-HCH transport system permease protein n=1 Tax=Halopseudomonas xinjiangensis TaxID=487184 RepID=A0A1H1LLJ8_9GAMM|nr:ABC transporter permease [Halopseudomonas xinjiangensis]SDR75423.1 phospholipid/cholesterol/gamma-HCH transport system permease protein [Halopseudomonas xinjiangensis]
MPALPDNPFITLNPANPAELNIRGDWTLEHYAELRRLTGATRSNTPRIETADIAEVGHLDTAGGQLLAELLGRELLQRITSDNRLPEERRTLLRRIAASLSGEEDVQPESSNVVGELLVRVGLATLRFIEHVTSLLGFIGLTLAGFARNIFRPSAWRITATVAQVEQTALDAVPIVALLTFMVGAVVAFLGATVLSEFGASIYTVDLIAFSFLREFAVMLTAILMAGRTASAFTAQIGSMKANEEIDAIRTLGLDPLDLLVLPRVLAMVIALPMLTFVAMLSGLFGGALVCALALDISPTMFMQVLQQNVDMHHFVLGIAKAPVFAFLIAIIGCLEGFKVTGSAESVGEHTTSSVVQSIFVVILVDAIAALFYMEMGW